LDEFVTQAMGMAPELGLQSAVAAVAAELGDSGLDHGPNALFRTPIRLSA